MIDEDRRVEMVNHLETEINSSLSELAENKKQIAIINKQRKALGDQKSQLSIEINKLEGNIKHLRAQQASLYRHDELRASNGEK